MNNKKDKPFMNKIDMLKAHYKMTTDLFKKNVIREADELFVRIKSYQNMETTFMEDGRLLVSFEPESWSFGLDIDGKRNSEIVLPINK